ncbi:hypothetical protein [Prosthecobacter sp.]|uniref:hypothetical protein n=1 Tax=Prosthecobacter sp. TaxID=1965333 RepID=UPI003784FC2D
MGRTDQLYSRLEALEEEFGVLLRREIERVAEGGFSRFLSRKIPHLFDGRKWLKNEAVTLERLESDIRQLRIQLFASDQDGVLGLLNQYLTMTETTTARAHGGRAHAARTVLKEWDSLFKR